MPAQTHNEAGGDDPSRQIARARELFGSARAVVVLTGAGVSAESKIPTFRDGMHGLWKDFDPQTLATPEAFAADPAMVTRWYDWRRLKCLEAEPNPGHLALAQMQRRLADRGGAFTLLTQNVDGMHKRAGSADVVELHGSIFAWRGVRSARPYPLPESPMTDYPPRFDDGEPARPGVVWFGETLPETALRRSFDALAACDLFFSVGTSSVVYPAAGFIEIARQNGAAAIEVNPEATPASSSADVVLRGPSGEMLPQLLDA